MSNARIDLSEPFSNRFDTDSVTDSDSDSVTDSDSDSVTDSDTDLGWPNGPPPPPPPIDRRN